MSQGQGALRGREDDGGGGMDGGAPVFGDGRAAERQAGEVLAGLSAEGPAWRVCGSGGGGEEHRLMLCEGLLEQALGCSELADVRFVFDDGRGEVGGHRGLLSSVSEVFAGMFRAGMEESETGKVRVRGVSRGSFRVFLEYVYVGRCGEGVGMADGRELWVLAEAYKVPGLREWLVREGVWGMESACSAMQYAKSAEGNFEELVEACEGRARWQLGCATEGGLRGVGVEAASALLAAHQGNRRLWRGCDVVEGLRYAERWVLGNGGAERVEAADIDRLVGLLDLSKLPLDVVTGVVGECGLVSGERVAELAAGAGEELGRDQLPGGLTPIPTMAIHAPKCYSLAVDDGGAEQLLAASDEGGRCVRVFKVEGGELVRTIGPSVEGLGELDPVYGLAFNGRGELLATDFSGHCIHVFGGDGGYLRSIRRTEEGEGELKVPSSLALSPEGYIIVSDSANDRVQVLREDGKLVRAFGSEGSGAGQFRCPEGVAVGADGSIVVADSGNARVQVFDREGAHVRTFGTRGGDAGEFEDPCGVCVLLGGQILVYDQLRDDLQVFSWEGVCLGAIGEESGSVELAMPRAVAVDSAGHVFVSCIKSERVCMLARGAA